MKNKLFKSSLKKKFIFGIFIIFFSSSVFLNYKIRTTFEENNNKKIEDSMLSIMNNSREFIRNQLTLENKPLNKTSFEESSYNIAVKLSLLNNCYVSMSDTNGNLIEAINPTLDNKYVSYKKDILEAVNNKSFYYLEDYSTKTILHFSYPIYFDNNFLGIASFKLDYTDFFKSNNDFIRNITIIQIITLLIAFLFTYYLITKITRPLNKLTSSVENITNGFYDNEIIINSNDEIGILAKKFNTMSQEIKNYIDKLQKEKNKIVKLEATRRDFFNNVTHELKTPLTGISAYAQLLSEGDLNDEEFQKRASNRILEESNRLHKLVIELLETSKGNSRIDEDFEITNTKLLIEDICFDLSLSLNKHNLKLVSSLENLELKCLKNKIKELVINLLDNAIKYSIPNTSIYINNYLQDNFWCLEIINSNEKISENILENLLEPFIRGNSKSKKGSLGLGLYICKTIVEEHEGSITLSSDTTFNVMIKIPFSETT
ncbi:hypothetical protein SAMN02745163_00478 [Clostridium cavendishii DSM 21758]|uniref:histidine kinase n=1 Tax=Clostridium cavendishii DSM 21758 TaxID=1121302 RepID=A0A1M6CIV2_9CLOT|nr:HAMP domain-containing sensor histidine kinase [Clostridium cavendishii]SHI60965.1 hypothetical protein SAMN02745163_00478 [Clostridium cavendishii DSM 21758]